jgi:acyl dehydratase
MKLMSWKVEPVRQRFTRRDTAFYALSLGIGGQAADRRQFRLVDPWNDDLCALPSMALVLAYPGFWLGRPEVTAATGVNPCQVLHIEQRVELEAPLPVQGKVVSETRVTALVDKGAERGSLLYSERSIFDEQSGGLLAKCSQVHFLRKIGGFGSAGVAPMQALPSSRLETSKRAVNFPTSRQHALLYRLNGDSNPLHFDPDVAAKSGFTHPILHGMCSAGIAVTSVLVALNDMDPQAAKGFSVRMSAPVLPGDTLETSVWPDGSFLTRAIERDQVVLHDGTVTLDSR